MTCFRKIFILTFILSSLAADTLSTDSGQWFSDAKFGLLINWGPYSVPAWAPSGVDTRNYQERLGKRILEGQFGGDNIFDFHQQNFGPDFSYYDFAGRFTASLFDSEDWIKLIQKSGARYTLLSAKERDGFCLWPNEQADDRGFLWHSEKLDLVGEFAIAARQNNIHYGFSYAVIEEFHPLRKSDPQKYITQHVQPQILDLLESYQPNLLHLSDYEKLDSNWAQISEILQKENISKEILVNDEKNRYFHAGADSLKPCIAEEVVLTIGKSAGYNREEDLADYLTGKMCVLILVDVVSQGKNLLLSIGTEGEGKIPLIFHERLLQTGRWLAVNGEAIYGTQPYVNSCQWTYGKRDSVLKGSYVDVMNQSVLNPPRGYARKEVLFTTKGDDLYAICPQYPGPELVINNIVLQDSADVTFLATQQKPEWYNKEGNLHIRTPKFVPEILKNELTYAYVFRLSNALKKKDLPEKTEITSGEPPAAEYPEPEIAVDYYKIGDKPVISVISPGVEDEIFYTLDGSEPDTTSTNYLSPFAINKSARIKVLAVNDTLKTQSRSEKFVKVVTEYDEVKLVYPPHKEFAGKGVLTLVDGVFGDNDEKSGKWLGFHDKDFIAEIRLTKEKYISSVYVSCLHNPDKNIMFPREFEIYTSYDNENFEYLKKMEIREFPDTITQKKFILEVPLQSVSSVRLFVKNYGALPDSIDGKPQKAWLFIDEMEVR